MIETKILSSLHRVFPENCPEKGITKISGMRNEPFSFQLAYRLKEKGLQFPLHITIETKLPLSCYAVEYVPVKHTGAKGFQNPPAIGMYPDILQPKGINKPMIPLVKPSRTRYAEQGEQTILSASGDCWQAYWVTVNEKGKPIPAGTYSITFRLFDSRDCSQVGKETLDVEIKDALLPRQTLYHTAWLYCDCIADLHNLPLYSEKFFKVLESYLTVAARHGMNMVLTPAFTPPLDTAIGLERMKTQLVKIEVKDGKYLFDFTLLKRFCALALKCGFKYFEHAHFFTQWGATSAPNIYATVNGKEKKIFGWNTPSSSKKYGKFLYEYIEALKGFMKEEKLEKRFLFHISDEPSETMIGNYRAAKAQLGNLPKDCMLGDALSNFMFYEDGSVPTPIVYTKEAPTFFGKCDNFWVYYTGLELEETLANRNLTSPPERNRIIGIQLYLSGAKGFASWNYNYYYHNLSYGTFDPRFYPGGYSNYPGISYTVYPSFNGTAMPSTRLVVTGDALNDVRALKLLEKRKGRKVCENLIRKHFGEVTFETLPESADQFIAFREELNQLI